MCGFVGILGKRGTVDCYSLNKMSELIVHRGPDDYCYKTFGMDGRRGNIAIGFRRLSIRDLTEQGRQPMSSADGMVTIAFNGEIYNADELKPDLIKAGHHFKSTSDTEVLLYAYLEWGIDKMLSKLDGMYAICIVDNNKDCLYLVRDKLGEKPLYIYDCSDVLMFGSEYKSFYAHPSFKAQLNEEVVDEYFLFRYISGGETLLKGVRNIMPGSYLMYKDGKLKEYVYWRIPTTKSNNLSSDDYKMRYLEIFDKGLKRRLISDVPVGIQLSGGVDSSFMTSRIAAMVDKPIHTFSITFKEKRYSEEPYIDIVNAKYDCVPHKFEWSPEMFFNTWRECTWSFEHPMNHEGTLGLMFLNRESKKYVTVMLCGEGADETLGGYPRFPLMSHRMYNPLESLVWRFIRSTRCMFKKQGFTPPSSLIDAKIGATQFVPTKMYNLLRSAHSQYGINYIYKKRRRLFMNCPGEGVHQYMNYEMQTYLQDLLMRADKVAMASSIECRVPYLMPELVEYACNIPEELLVEPSPRKFSMHSKLLLKNLCKEEFGNDFVYRPKVGFSMPILNLISSTYATSYIEDVLLPGIKERGLVDYSNISKLWNKRNIPASESDGTMWALWVAFSFELWAQIYLDLGPEKFNHITL